MCDNLWSHDFSSTTQTLSVKVCNGLIRAKQGRRKPGCFNHRWKKFFSHFSIRKAWSIKNFCPRRLQWMRSCIWTSSDVPVNEFVVFGLSCGQTTPGCSFQTTHPRTLPLKFMNFSQKIMWMCWTTHHIHLISLRATFFYSVKLKILSKVIVFKVWRHSKKNRLPHLKALRKRSSVHVSSNGNITWTSVFSPG